MKKYFRTHFTYTIIIGIGLFMGAFPEFWGNALTVKGFIFAVNIFRTLFLIALDGLPLSAQK